MGYIDNIRHEDYKDETEDLEVSTLFQDVQRDYALELEQRLKICDFFYEWADNDTLTEEIHAEIKNYVTKDVVYSQLSGISQTMLLVYAYLTNYNDPTIFVDDQSMVRMLEGETLTYLVEKISPTNVFRDDFTKHRALRHFLRKELKDYDPFQIPLKKKKSKGGRFDDTFLPGVNTESRRIREFMQDSVVLDRYKTNKLIRDIVFEMLEAHYSIVREPEEVIAPGTLAAIVFNNIRHIVDRDKCYMLAALYNQDSERALYVSSFREVFIKTVKEYLKDVGEINVSGVVIKEASHKLRIEVSLEKSFEG